ncbi:hypothetical protein YC2023_052934 [Brassica napus]
MALTNTENRIVFSFLIHNSSLSRVNLQEQNCFFPSFVNLQERKESVCYTIMIDLRQTLELREKQVRFPKGRKYDQLL